MNQKLKDFFTPCKGMQLFTAFGFPIHVDIMFAALVGIWTITTLISSGRYDGGLVMIITGLVIVAHELGHALAARRCGATVRMITLGYFGGIAVLSDPRPYSPWREIFVTICGPLVNVLLIGLSYLALWCLHLQLSDFPKDAPGFTIVGFIWMNTYILTLNLLPFLPLDGGRLFRAILSLWLRNTIRATLMASILTAVAALTLLVVAIYHAMFAYAVLAIFLLVLAKHEYKYSLCERLESNNESTNSSQESPLRRAPTSEISSGPPLA